MDAAAMNDKAKRLAELCQPGMLRRSVHTSPENSAELLRRDVQTEQKPAKNYAEYFRNDRGNLKTARINVRTDGCTDKRIHALCSMFDKDASTIWRVAVALFADDVGIAIETES